MRDEVSVIRIGNAQGFWGDTPGAAARLVLQQPDLDYLTLDYLAEVSMSIMAIQRDKDPVLGYAKDFLDVIRSLIPLWKQGSRVKLITNAGGLNPLGCANACFRLLQEAGCSHKCIGVISGDDVMPLLRTQPGDPLFHHLETHQPLTAVHERLVTANAYLGAKPIAEALSQGAEIVITGRVADPSLTVAPCAAHFGWSWQEYDRLAGATVAGHLIECGTQVTGGISTRWLEIPNPANIGFPIVEVDSYGHCIVTKPAGTGGLVSVGTVKEQLLYEIGNPSRYLSPDATVSFLSLQVEQQAENRVKVFGATGKAPPETYKVSATYRDGFKAEGLLALIGPDLRKKAQRCGEVIFERVQQAGYKLQRTSVECIGMGDLVPGVLPERPEPVECMVRFCVADDRQEAIEQFSKEIAGMVTSGPQGITGYSSGRPSVRQVFSYWPCLVPRRQVKARLQLMQGKTT